MLQYDQQLLANKLRAMELLIAEIRASVGMTAPTLDVAGSRVVETTTKPKRNKVVLNPEHVVSLISRHLNRPDFANYISLNHKK